MDLGLTNKTILITGGSKGIGLACAKGFLAEGARVAICSRSQSNIDAALANLPNAIGITADLTDPQAAAAMVEQITAKLGPIDILVNSAGAARRTPAEDLTPAAWRAAMDAKYFSYIFVIDPVIKQMAARKTGVIINVIGNGGKFASPVHIAGGAANAALMLATAGLAAAYAGQNVRVAGVNPGLTDTDRVAEGMQATARAAGQTIEQARAASITKIPMGRMAAPAEIADTVIYLASARASYVTGVAIGMDGAQTPVI
jgi:NAD(P)-dependent dehydrogenase (short-subunit alcohol dehydrogenase family)